MSVKKGSLKKKRVKKSGFPLISLLTLVTDQYEVIIPFYTPLKTSKTQDLRRVSII